LPFFAHFEINIVSALAEQLTAAFEKLEPASLSEETLAQVPSEQGVYHLFRNGVLVYVGKAANLRSRLGQHRFKIRGRRNIEINEITFTCLTVHKNWTALAPESSLIGYYKRRAGNLCEWNGNGFGPHDPGRERETSNKPPEGFDSQFPIRDDWPCAGVVAVEWNIRELLMQIKSELPFLLRYEAVDKNYRLGHPDYNNKTLAIAQAGKPVSELLGLITQHIPGWQSTQFPSHMILYKEDRNYAHGTAIWRQPSV
jgi:hypothetical protein